MQTYMYQMKIMNLSVKLQNLIHNRLNFIRKNSKNIMKFTIIWEIMNNQTMEIMIIVLIVLIKEVNL
jgi:hypothetical protein